MSNKAFQSIELDEWHRKLNSKEHAPARGYRRNVTVYKLVCYVNNIIGCYLSHNDHPITVFIGRAKQFMHDNPAEEQWLEYYEMVNQYLNSLEGHLVENGIDTSSIYS